uniref:FG-GAP repeat-containing protein n=1 Tax=Candidatus Kentrum sp. UNK TaxID=2126344 RepID=A0A451A8T7_9GAMM|nr:MAG: FG-GAP repeat-containing protein [Candidatus Kentron sp. UNK]VFK70510.1 MAG: FG-GAP repeat-containing protein [Candidatus Kentron sp. UNK]
MTDNTNLVKTYTDRAYKHTTMVRHQGKVIAFAMDDKRRIVYTMLDTSAQDNEKGVFDAKYWSKSPKELIFPTEITQVGYSLIANTPMPTVKRNTREEAEPGELLPREIDPFLSSTARLTADASFQVLSDGQYLYLFRQSLNNGDADMVYKLTDGNASGDTNRTDIAKDSSDNNISLVNKTLLADRFILSGENLANVREIRYRRSTHKTRPHGNKDSLGAVDMQKRPFFEPTHELAFIDNLEKGRFSALLLPTKIPDIKRWQFFTHNSATGRIDSINLERSSEGLFDTRGTRFYTSPDSKYRTSVFEKKQGQCPFTSKDLVPVTVSSGHGETCLAFDGSNDYVTIPALGGNFEDITLEAWVWLDSTAADVTRRGVMSETLTGGKARMGIFVDQGKLQAGFFEDNTLNGVSDSANFPKGQWVHVAASYDGDHIRLYRDGEQVAVSDSDLGKSLPASDNPWVIGRNELTTGAAHWQGKIDEVRLWNAARADKDIDAWKGQRLLGDEPGLVAYWRMDEADGTTLHDQTNGAHDGALKNADTATCWVASTAPIGDSPGMRRTSFSVEDRDVAAGMSALLYFQQENVQSGYNQDAKPLKKQARVMLAVPTKTTDASDADKDPYIAAVDFGISQEGRLAQTPDVLDLPVIDTSINETLENIATKERQVAKLLAQTDFWALGDRKVVVDSGSKSAVAVSVEGNRAVIGVSNENKAYIFERSGEAWTKKATLTPTGGAASDHFGFAVSVSGDRVLIGAHLHHTNGQINAGAAYIFERGSNGSWTQKQKLDAGDNQPHNDFGVAVSIEGERALIGAAWHDVSGKANVGAAYIFEYDSSDGQWKKKQELMSSDGAAGDHFGFAVSLSGDRALIGARLHDTWGQTNAGAAYVFERNSSGQWSQKQKLMALDNKPYNDFGVAVSMEDNRAVIGAGYHDADGKTNVGAAYAFECDHDGRWSQKQKLMASDGAAGDRFGMSVSLSDDRVVIGCHLHDSGAGDTGAAYIFQRNGIGEWREERKLTAGDGVAGDQFGFRVSISGDSVVTGTNGTGVVYDSADNPVGNGAVWFFRRGLSPAAETQKKQLEGDITTLRNSLGQDAAEGMPVLATDVSGLTVGGSLLKFAYADTRPQLFPRSDGLVGLYFRGSSRGQFYGASFDSTVSQALFALTAGSNKVFLQARAAGADMSDTTITVEGASADTCKLTIKNSKRKITETWDNVPREAGQFEQVINGQAANPIYVGKLASAASGTVTSLALTADGLQRALPGGANLRVGTTVLTTGAALTKKAADVTIVSVDLTAAADTPVYWIPYDYANASVTPARYALRNGSVLVRAHAPEVAASELVANGNATAAKVGASGVWVAEAPGNTYRFDGDKNHLALPDAKRAQMDIEGDATLEAWVKPSFDIELGRVAHHHTDEASYSLGVRGIPSALRFDGNDEYVKVPCNPDFDLTEGTLEAWFKPEWNSATSGHAAIMALRNNGSSRYGIYVRKDYKGVMEWHVESGTRVPHSVGFSLTKSEWHHIALVMGNGTITIYLDGNQVGSTSGSFGTTTGCALHIGSSSGNKTDPFQGSIDEVRIWNVPRSAEEIRQYKDVALFGSRPGLVGCWRFTGGKASDYSGNKRSGACHGFLDNTDVSAALTASPISGYRPFAALGGRFIQTADVLPAGSWRHLAAVYNQAYALAFDGRDNYLEADDSSALNITKSLTIEAIIRPDRVDRDQLIIGKGDPNRGNQVPYWLELTRDGGIRFIQSHEEKDPHDEENDKPKRKTVSVSGKLTAGTIHKIAVVREEITEMPSEDNNFKMRTHLKMDLYVDGVRVKDEPLIKDAVMPDINSRPLHIGGTDKGHYFNGAISELRLWSSARESQDLHKSLVGNEVGLQAWWRLEENEGKLAGDAKGGSHAVIYSADWIKDPRPAGSSLALYVNGERQKTVNLSASDVLVTAGWGDAQFTLGARRHNSEILDPFKGEIEEARIWKCVRTEEQLLDNLFTRLKEDKTDLAGYYTFDTVTDTKVLDSGLLASNLLLGSGDNKPTRVLSTAPISTDTSEVRPALAGIETDFHRRIDSAPTVAEYGDTQYDADGQFSGAMKRCYGYIDDGRWRLVTGYKVGNLVREWVGQVQFDPQVIGFIEGAPPVPSENMTFGTNGTGTGTYEGDGAGITFTQADEVTYSYATGRENGYHSAMAIDSAAGFAGTIQAVTAPMGGGIATDLSVEVLLGGKVELESEGAYATERNFSTGRNRARSLEVTLGGNWEDTDTANQYNSYLGRRWMPANMGIALVQSETADMFALRLAHNQALVSYSMQPNPDIPKDWNLLPFPINPRYVKQGTLDGKVGFDKDKAVVEDPDYKNIAKDYGEHSYFKPTEAYALKRRIEQEEQRLKTNYDNFDASQIGGPLGAIVKNRDILTGGAATAAGVGAGAAAVGGLMSGSGVGALAGPAVAGLLGAAVGTFATFSGLVDVLRDEKKPSEKFSKRNLANTYVWTADGGFYAETSETTEVIQESINSSTNFTSGFSGGFSADVKGVGIGAEFEINAGINLGLTNTSTKSKEASKTFSLDVSVSPSGDMQYHDPADGEGVYDSNGNPSNCLWSGGCLPLHDLLPGRLQRQP